MATFGPFEPCRSGAFPVLDFSVTYVPLSLAPLDICPDGPSGQFGGFETSQLLIVKPLHLAYKTIVLRKSEGTRMLNFVRSSATAAALAFASSPFGAAPAAAYPIDCAILICLSGGFPPSVPCERARAEFIRRITPWPIEPPLQIWRCPMGISYEADPSQTNVQRFFDIAMGRDVPGQSYPQEHPAAVDAVPQPAVMRLSGDSAARLPESLMLQLVQDYSDDNGSADIDISGDAFSFVRSIRVYHVQASQREVGDTDPRCYRFSDVRLGTYGVQGDFGWTRSSVSALPAAHVGLERYGQNCPSTSSRSVFMEWRDYAGQYGYEQVNY